MDNHWLASLGAEDQSRLTPHLHPRDFEQGEVMHEAGEPSEAIWFPTAGAISLLTIVNDQRAVETAVIGADAWHAAGYTGAGVRIGVIDYFSATFWHSAEMGPVPWTTGHAICRDEATDCSSSFDEPAPTGDPG